jgi:hypothetical protein
MNKTFLKYFPKGLLIGERKEGIATLQGIKKPEMVFMTKEELTCLRCKYLTLGVIVFAVLSWIIMLLL